MAFGAFALTQVNSWSIGVLHKKMAEIEKELR